MSEVTVGQPIRRAEVVPAVGRGDDEFALGADMSGAQHCDSCAVGGGIDDVVFMLPPLVARIASFSPVSSTVNRDREVALRVRARQISGRNCDDQASGSGERGVVDSQLRRR